MRVALTWWWSRIWSFVASVALPKLDTSGSFWRGMEYEVIDRVMDGVEFRVGSSVDVAAGRVF